MARGESSGDAAAVGAVQGADDGGGGEAVGAERVESSAECGAGADVGGMGIERGGVGQAGERVVIREGGVRVEEWSERRRGKRKAEAPVMVALDGQAPVRKIPKGGKIVLWTAVARDEYVERQRRYERGEGGGVT